MAKTRKLDIDCLDKPRAVPLADTFRKVGKYSGERAEQMLDDGRAAPVEIAGEASVGSLLIDMADGTLTDTQSYNFRRDFADKKTPAPVVRIQEDINVNMSVLLAGIIADNAEALSRTIERNVEQRKVVKERWGLTTTLELPSAEGEGVINELPGEPEEIAVLRDNPGEVLPSRGLSEDAEIRDTETGSGKRSFLDSRQQSYPEDTLHTPEGRGVTFRRDGMPGG